MESDREAIQIQVIREFVRDVTEALESLNYTASTCFEDRAECVDGSAWLCPICYTRFSKLSYVAGHVKRKHKVEDFTAQRIALGLVCPVCNFRARGEGVLGYHMYNSKHYYIPWVPGPGQHESEDETG